MYSMYLRGAASPDADIPTYRPHSPDAGPLPSTQTHFIVMWPAMHAGKAIPLLWTEWGTGVKNITLPQTSFEDGQIH